MKRILIALLVAIPVLAETKVRNSITVGAVVNLMDKGPACNGSGNDQPALVLAIGALGANGGVVDARGCAGMTLTSSLTISKQGTKILLPPGTVALGSSQIIVSQGTHSVTLEGTSSFGSGSAGTTVATNITYSGTGAAIVVGSAAGITTGFQMKNLSVATNSGGANAVGLQLNTTIDYTLYDVRITSNQTQWNIDLEGYSTYTGGTMIHPWLDGNNGEAIHFGKAANANFIYSPHVSMGAVAGTCFNFDGGGGPNGGGNRIYGGDCENATTVMRFDFETDNQIIGLRAETCTNAVIATANSTQNYAFTSGTSSMAITDSGTNNAFTDNFWTQINRRTWKMKNATDATSTVILQAGLTTNQLIEIQLANFGENWRINHDTSGTFKIWRGSTGQNRINFQASNTFIDGESAGTVGFNLTANSATGGVAFGTGGASPTTAASVDGAGRFQFGTFTNGTLGTPANGKVVYCSDCTIANPCAGGGTGAIAKRLNGAWVCN